jgi:spermidine synthase
MVHASHVFYENIVAILSAVLVGVGEGRAADRVVLEITSPYHHIRVIDKLGIRTLSFDGSMESRMSLRNPLTGHFEYIEYFHMPWLWNSNLARVLMIGLGGASVQRAYEHYYPDVTIETAEIDPTVVRIAKEYFGFKESDRQRVHVTDGRMHLRRTETQYDAIILDAYVKNRYGSFIPYHLATREFFELARDRLSTNGVLAYNVIGTVQGWRADILGSVFKTIQSVFPNVYLFPARETWNVVLIGTKSPRTDSNTVQQRANALIQSRRLILPGFRNRLLSFRADPPANFHLCPVLTDDFAPVDGLLSKTGR